MSGKVDEKVHSPSEALIRLALGPNASHETTWAICLKIRPLLPEPHTAPGTRPEASSGCAKLLNCSPASVLTHTVPAIFRPGTVAAVSRALLFLDEADMTQSHEQQQQQPLLPRFSPVRCILQANIDANVLHLMSSFLSTSVVWSSKESIWPKKFKEEMAQIFPDQMTGMKIANLARYHRRAAAARAEYVGFASREILSCCYMMTQSSLINQMWEWLKKSGNFNKLNDALGSTTCDNGVDLDVLQVGNVWTPSSTHSDAGKGYIFGKRIFSGLDLRPSAQNIDILLQSPFSFPAGTFNSKFYNVLQVCSVVHIYFLSHNF